MGPRVRGLVEKAAQICTAVKAQGWYSQALSAFLLMGGNICGKDVKTRVHMKPAPVLPCSRTHKATDP